MNIKIVIILIVLIMLVIIGVIVYRRKIISVIPIQNYQPFIDVWTDKNKNGNLYREVAENMLSKVVQYLQHLGIDTIPIYDSLLGMVRHGKMIPWNDNIDICVNKEYFETILEHKNNFEEKGIGVVEVLFKKVHLIKFFDLTEPMIPGKNWSWPFIDIFSWEKKGEYIIITDVSKPYEHKINKADFLPFKCNMFGNIVLSFPNNPDAFLNLVYGNDWENKCVSSSYNNRKERRFNHSYTLECSETTPPLENNLFNNTWVINLESRPDRWKLSEKRLKSLGITPKRWIATDAKSQEFLDEYKRIPYPKSSKGEVACYKSHYALWSHLREIDVETALIFEDDIIFPTNTTKKDILEHMNKSIGFNIIYLGHCYSNQILFDTPETKVGTALCLHAYIVSRYGLKKLLEEDQNYGLPIDKITHKFCLKNLCYISKHNNHEKDTFGYGIVHQDRETLGSDITDRAILF